MISLIQVNTVCYDIYFARIGLENQFGRFDSGRFRQVLLYYMISIMRKPVFRAYSQVRLKSISLSSRSLSHLFASQKEKQEGPWALNCSPESLS